MSKKLTANQQEYKKQIERINRFYKRAEKRGYRFHDKVSLEIPKRVTKKSLESIQLIKPKQLYEQAEYLDPMTGKIVGGTEGRRIERRAAYYKGRERQQAIKDYTPNYSPPSATDEILHNADMFFQSIDYIPLLEAENEIMDWQPEDRWSPEFALIKEHDKDQFLTMLDGAIQNLGRDIVAMNIEQHAAEFNREMESLLYGQSGDKKDGVQPNLIALHRILYQESPNVQQMADYLDRHEEGLTQAHNIVTGVHPSSKYEYEEVFE